MEALWWTLSQVQARKVAGETAEVTFDQLGANEPMLRFVIGDSCWEKAFPTSPGGADPVPEVLLMVLKWVLDKQGALHSGFATAALQNTSRAKLGWEPYDLGN